jgi:hypothetical protein
MPATVVAEAGTSSGTNVLTSDDIWCLIDYIRSLGPEQD